METAPPPTLGAREVFEAAVNPPVPAGTKPLSQGKDVVWKVASTSWGQAVLGALVIFIVLFLINPPMVQSQSESDDIEQPRRDMKKVLIWSGLTGGLILFVPLLLKWCKSRSCNSSPE